MHKIMTLELKKKYKPALNNKPINNKPKHLSHAVYTDGIDPCGARCCIIKSLMSFLDTIIQ